MIFTFFSILFLVNQIFYFYFCFTGKKKRKDDAIFSKECKFQKTIWV